MQHRPVISFIVCALLCVSAAARAQVSTGSIAGVVRDTSGAVLPGVTVEAASPALIEKVRSVVSDAQGNYKIVELRTGVYSVTFSLPGFSTVRREGVEISSGFTAAVNTDLKVGQLEETVVVSGASPVVDVQNVRTQQVLSRTTLDALPTAKTISAFANLTLGVTGYSSPTIDVGGNKGETFLAFSVHGGSNGDARSLLDGMDVAYGGTLARRNSVNQAIIQEVALQTRGMSAETENGGVLINTIPKDGGNEVKLWAVANGTAPRFQGNNIGTLTRQYGITQVAGIKHVYEIAVGLGGPVVKDKLWFYAANMWQGSGEYTPGVFFNATQHTSWFYTPDETQRKYTTYDIRDHSGRLTWQATEKQKMGFFTSWQYSCLCFKLSGGVDANRSPEASIEQRGTPVVTQLTWQYPTTNRLLLEVGTTILRDASRQFPVGGAKAGDIAKEELATGFKWGARMEAVGAGNDYGNTRYFRIPYRASVSYVTGSHALKTGTVGRLASSQINSGPEPFDIPPYRLQVRNRVPAQITMFATPYQEDVRTHEFGFFVQDQWTLSKLTLNGGVRLDMLGSSSPEVNGGAGLFRSAATYPADNPGWVGKDISPRMGAAYDVFGNGKTAIKTSLGRYVAFTGGGIAPGLAGANNFAQLITSSTTRNWTDTNGNLIPDCVLTTFTANGECGALANLTLGSTRPGTNFDLDQMRGWQQRGYNWQFNTNLQHQLGERLAAGVGYYRTWYGNFTVTQNRAVTAANFDTFCVAAPVDTRLPNSGQQICGLYDVKPAQFGLVDNLITKASEFGNLQQYYDGFDFSLNTRFGGGKLLAGGVSFGRTVTDNCDLSARPEITATGLTAATPRSEAYCHNEQPWSSSAQLKLQGVYPFPWWGLQMSGTMQNVNTFDIAATRSYTNAEIRTGLGRDLGSCRGAATCAGTAAISLIPAATYYGTRLTQLDLRFTKSLKLGRARLVGNFDAYNVLNSGAAVNVNATYGNGTTPGSGTAGTNAWQRPLTLIGPRLFKFGGQLDW